MGISSKFHNPTVGIIGGTGKMGSWFAELSEKAGAKVFRVGRKTSIRPENVAKECDVVVISVPISVTYKMIKEIGPLIPEDSLFMDLTSIKKMPMEAMLKYSKAEVVGVHPLFGIDIDPEMVKRVVICRGRGKDGEEWIVNLLKKAGFDLIFLEPEEHDKLMGLIQGVNHFETMSLPLKIKDSGIPLDKITNVSTHTFMKKLDRIKKMFEQESELFCSILMDNEWSIYYINSYLKTANQLQKIIKEKDRDSFKDIFQTIKKFLKAGGV